MKKQKDFFGAVLKPPETCLIEVTRGGAYLLCDYLSSFEGTDALIEGLIKKYKLNAFKPSQVTMKNSETSVAGISFSVNISTASLAAKLGKPKKSSITVFMGLLDSKDKEGQPLAGMFFDDQCRLDLYLTSLPYWSKIDQYIGSARGIQTLIRSLEMAAGHELIHAIQEIYGAFSKDTPDIASAKRTQTKSDIPLNDKYYLDPEEYHPLLLTVVDLMIQHLQQVLIKVKTSRDTPRGKKIIADIFLVITGLSDAKETGIDAVVKQSTKITGFMRVLRDRDPNRWKKAVRILMNEVLKPLLKD